MTRSNLPAQSARAIFTEKRTYLRPLDEDSQTFETPDEALDRVIGHQRWLWEQAQGHPLDLVQEAELSELRDLMIAKKVSASGRVKWMGGTDIVKMRASAAFNCSFTEVETPADVVDVFWLLLQGCGVGFLPVPGLLTGFPSSIRNVEFVGSTRTDKGGAEDTTETVEDGVWTITFGDSAKGWSKGAGKLLAEKPRVHTLRIILDQLRPGGKRLKGYGWLSSGWQPLRDGLKIITDVLMRKADQILDAIDIGDIINALGTVLSSRRSAQIWLHNVGLMGSPDLTAMDEEFIDAKTDRHENGNAHREQSNNSVVFWTQPTPEMIRDLLMRILATGEPGFVNGVAAKARAPEFVGVNPCAEILLPSKGFCNLMQVVFHRFNGDYAGLLRAQELAARANYRQTCVSMRDGVLQLQWDDNQKLLRLCGVSPTGYVAWEYAEDAPLVRGAAAAARNGANSMADELGLPRPRRVTQVQPAGTVSKVMGLLGDEVHEGAHLSPSRYIFNWVNFSIHDRIVDDLIDAGYRVKKNPVDKTAVLVCFPVAYPDHRLYKEKVVTIDGREEILEISSETAIDQLERYKFLMTNYVDHNCSITVSFDEHEIEDMVDWFEENWDSYVGVSFLKRNDPTRTAEELGFKYLPQECVSRRMFEEYVETLKPINMANDTSDKMLDDLIGCDTGACPVR